MADTGTGAVDLNPPDDEELPDEEVVEDEDDVLDILRAVEPKAEPEEPKEEEPAADPQEEEPQEEPKPEAVEVAPTQAEEAPALPPAPQESPEDMRKRYADQREAALKQVAEVYKLDPKVVDAMDPEFAEAVPQALARVFMDSVQESVRQTLNLLPGVITQLNSRETAAQAAERGFYERWPQLQGREQDLLPIAEAYRQANPNATPKEFQEQVGAMAHVALGIDLAAPEPVAPEVVHKPVARSPVAAPPSPQPSNPFAEMAAAYVEQGFDDG